MKGLQKISAIILFLMTISSSFACDVCSCGASGSASFTGSLNSNYIGFSYNYLHFSFKEGIVDNSLVANDYINTANLLGQYFVTDRIQINTIIPYRFNKRETSIDNVYNDGVGDITVYSLIGLLKKESKHSLKIGAGLKLPTGSFNLQRANTNQTSATQLGTGSLDVMLPIQYRLQLKKVAIDVNGTYFIKNDNKDDFKYGNQSQLNMSISYAVELNENNAIIPFLGMNHDNFKPTERFNIADKRTSGYMNNANFGVKANINKLVMVINYQIPVKQKLIEGELSFEKSIGLFTYYRF